jgi:hypothetical protein
MRNKSHLTKNTRLRPGADRFFSGFSISAPAGWQHRIAGSAEFLRIIYGESARLLQSTHVKRPNRRTSYQVLAANLHHAFGRCPFIDFSILSRMLRNSGPNTIRRHGIASPQLVNSFADKSIVFQSVTSCSCRHPKRLLLLSNRPEFGRSAQIFSLSTEPPSSALSWRLIQFPLPPIG